MSYTVILPTLNEKNHIVNLITDIADIFKKNNLKYEIIIVDDNSEDGTIDVVKEYQKKNDLVKLFVRKDERRSLPESINLGIKNSSYENLIWMDADYQHPPRYILDLTKNSTNYDLVICSRFLKESERYFNREELKKELNENQSFVFNKLCNFNNR